MKIVKSQLLELIENVRIAQNDYKIVLDNVMVNKNLDDEMTTLDKVLLDTASKMLLDKITHLQNSMKIDANFTI